MLDAGDMSMVGLSIATYLEILRILKAEVKERVETEERLSKLLKSSRSNGR